jgi:NAD(P)-dependent dehydrogenase (short-subunit alcohol dehydrogenase family)
LNGKTIIVTGAAGGLGSALSLCCSRDGFTTVMLDSDRRGLEQAYDRITEAGFTDPALYPLDLAAAGTDDFDEMLGTIESEFGGLDAVVHCAARFEGLSPLDQVSPPEWLMHLQVNLNAAWLLSVQSLPLLRKSASAQLYFLLEDLPKVEGSFWGPYGVSKHALKALVSQLAAECGPSGIQVLGINPGPLRSELRSRGYHSENPASQPDPNPVAEQILHYLNGSIRADGTFVNLQEKAD